MASRDMGGTIGQLTYWEGLTADKAESCNEVKKTILDWYQVSTETDHHNFENKSWGLTTTEVIDCRTILDIGELPVSWRG